MTALAFFGEWSGGSIWKFFDSKINEKKDFEVTQSVQIVLPKYKEWQEIIVILGIDELSKEDKLLVSMTS
jgi:F-type H+-transporting ATPase subunit beta